MRFCTVNAFADSVGRTSNSETLCTHETVEYIAISSHNYFLCKLSKIMSESG